MKRVATACLAAAALSACTLMPHYQRPQSPEELAHHDYIVIGSRDTIAFSGPKEKIEVPVRVALRYRSLNGAAHAVAAGIGLSALPATFFEDPPLKSVLTPILTNYPLENPKLYVVYVSRTYLPLKIRTFVDFLIQEFSTAPPAKLTVVP